MIAVTLILSGYAVLIAKWGVLGALAALAHAAIVLAACQRSGR